MRHNLVSDVVVDEEEVEADADDEAADERSFMTSINEGTEAVAKSYIHKFFATKKMHYGGAIPASVLNAKANLELVLETSLDNAVDRAYKLMAGQVDNLADEGNIADDTKVVVSFLRECASSQIPKVFAGGLMLMYLELCMGMRIQRCAARTGF